MSDEHRDDLVETAQRYLPGGSSWMWTLPRDISFVVDRAEGSHLIDTNGRRFIDYALGSGPLLLGHAHPALTAAVKAQIDRGSTYQWLSEPTVRLAEMICKASPCGDQVRFVSTGTEATMYAIRIARVATRREKVLKFEGGWHGLHDYALVGNGWRPSTEPYPTPTADIGGIPKGAARTSKMALPMSAESFGSIRIDSSCSSSGRRRFRSPSLVARHRAQFGVGRLVGRKRGQMRELGAHRRHGFGLGDDRPEIGIFLGEFGERRAGIGRHARFDFRIAVENAVDLGGRDQGALLGVAISRARARAFSRAWIRFRRLSFPPDRRCGRRGVALSILWSGLPAM